MKILDDWESTPRLGASYKTPGEANRRVEQERWLLGGGIACDGRTVVASATMVWRFLLAGW